MVYGFAVQSGGRVTIASKLDEGTSVTIALPTALTARPKAREVQGSSPVRRDE